jgi:hypothetical protein
MSSQPAATRGKLDAGEAARFTALVAILAIFADAAVGHGLTWENDPYWTYWITKTFLIATIFGLGTAWFGIGVGRGGAITGVHTLVLTIYYWTLSPIGLPSSPEWLDLEHTWVSGLPIHFGVIYLGYLLALWLWRRRAALTEERGSSPGGTAALLTSVAVVVVSGGLASAFLGDFPGFSWFLVRALVTVPFLLWWWAWAGRDSTAAIVGGVVLAFIWATYSQFLGPVGLPDTPLRILDASPPPATVEWLDYRQLWLVSFPTYMATMVGVLLLSLSRGRRRGSRPAAGVLAVASMLALTGATSEQTLDQDGADARLSAAGEVQVETGDFYSDEFESGTGEVDLQAEDMGSRVTPLPPHDRLTLLARVSTDEEIVVSVKEAMVGHPLGEHSTWWGIGLGVEHHGVSGIGTDQLPPIKSELAAFGLGDLTLNGDLVATGVPVHIMTAESGLPNGAHLELDVGMEGQEIPELGAGHLRVLWSDYEAEIEHPHTRQYLIGGLALLVLLGAVLGLIRRQPAR